MDPHARIAVVGGGIFGTATALGLGREGSAHVELLERDHLGAGSTALAGGLLSLHTWNDADAGLIYETRQQLVDLVAWGREHELPAARTAWKGVGGITVVPPERRPLLETFLARLRKFGVEAEILAAQPAARRFPAFRFEPPESVLWSAEGGIMESTDVLELARAQAKSLGVRVREGKRVDAIEAEKGRVVGLRIGGSERTRYDVVILCGGAWTKPLLATCGAYLPLASYRTQIATIEIPQVGDTPILHDLAHGFYARAESEERLLAGDGTQLREFDPDTFDRGADTEFVERTAERVLRRYARGADARYRRGWAGLCTGTPDRRPILGPVPGVDNLWILSGDNGFGLMRGLALGTRLAAGVAGRAVRPEDAGARSDRFGPHPPRTFPLSEGFSYPPVESAIDARTSPGGGPAPRA